MSHASVPPYQLYAAILDRPVSRGRSRREELRHAFEPLVPGGLAGVHPVYHDLSNGRVLAIGTPQAVIESLGSSVVTASPASWPVELADELSDVQPNSINLLSGSAEPLTLRRARTQLRTHAAIGLALVCAGLSALLQQRINHHEQLAQLARQESRSVQLAALGPGAANSRQPPSSLLTSELRKLRATRAALATDTAGREPSDADILLASLLEAWPSEAEARTESVTVAPRSVELVTTVPSLDHAETLMKAMRGVPGLEVGDESTDQDRDRIRVSMRLNRETSP